MRPHQILALPLFLALHGCGASDVEAPPIPTLLDEIARTDPGTVLAFAMATIPGEPATPFAAAGRNQRVRMHPASTLKLILAATAIDAGLLDRSLVTRLLVDTKSTALLLEGAGDPLLSKADLESLWRRAAQVGVALDESLLVDSSLFDGVPFGAGWMWDDEPSPYMPYVSALTVESGVVDIVVSRPHEPERDPVVIFDPPAPLHFHLDLEIERVATPATSRPTLARDVLGDRRRVRVFGPLAPGDEVAAEFSVPDPDLFTGEVLASIADPSRGVSDRARVVRVPRLSPQERARFREVARVERPLADVLRHMLKHSDNLAAECVLRLLAVITDPTLPGSADRGVWVVARYLATLGFAPDDYTIVDGSGLSFYDSVSADLLLAVLLDMAARPTFDRFRDMLPVAGVDGTLATRFVDSPVTGRIHAKTGTLSGVSGLAGYATTPRGEVRAFALLAGEYTGSARPWRERLDALATLIADR